MAGKRPRQQIPLLSQYRAFAVDGKNICSGLSNSAGPIRLTYEDKKGDEQ